MPTDGLVISSLGGPHTFGGQAAQRMLELYPQFTRIDYFPTAEEAFEAVMQGKAAATCAPEQMAKTGVHPGIQDHIVSYGSKAHVAFSVIHTYHCALLVKPGASTEQVRRVLGHTGSITQSRDWLEKNLPQAEIEIVDTSSYGAAMTVLAGDGSIASVGTPEAARAYGLEIAAAEIDGGSSASYWAISRDPFFVDRPTVVVVAGRFKDDGCLSDLVVNLTRAGYKLLSVYPRASGQALYEYDYVIQFTGQGTLQAVQEALAPFPQARLAGAYELRD